MLGLGLQSPISSAEQQKNNRHRHGYVVAVLAVLFVYIYLFTQSYKILGIPNPEELAQAIGLEINYIFEDDGLVDSELYISDTKIFNNDDERLILFLSVGISFLLAYYLPFKMKQPALAFCFMVIVDILFGHQAIAVLLASHVTVYLVLHPLLPGRLKWSILPGILYWLAAGFYSLEMGTVLFTVFLSGYVSFMSYKIILLPFLNHSKFAHWLRSIIVHSAAVTVFIGAVWEGFGGAEWKLPLGIILFFWHWQRLFIYYMDYQAGQVPKDISLPLYLSIFFNPAQITNWRWGPVVGQGYSYTANSFYSKDKNRIILDGIKLLGWGMFYLALGDWIKYNLVIAAREMGFTVFWRLSELSCHFVLGGAVDTPTVLLTTLFDQIKWFLLMAGVLHFKVGIWKICGYDIEPYMNRPWLATNLVSLWGRITLHYRDFLIRCFYYPCFFRFFKKNTTVRIFAAIMAAVVFGNLVWGNMVRRLVHRGVEWKYIEGLWVTWPHFVMLGIGIAVSAFWLMNKKNKTRKPWTLDRKFPVDILSMYITLQYYSLTHVFFYRCEQGTVWDHFRLFFVGFGINP
jgi:hypothetical protein